jgi:hypothetical protein
MYPLTIFGQNLQNRHVPHYTFFKILTILIKNRHVPPYDFSEKFIEFDQNPPCMPKIAAFSPTCFTYAVFIALPRVAKI